MSVKLEVKLMVLTITLLLFPIIDIVAQDSPSEEPSTIAVLDLDMEAGIPDEYQGLLSDLLREELFGTGVFIVLERDKMEEMLAEQGLQMSGAVSDAKVVEFGKLLGVESMLAGSVGQIGEMLIISLRLIDVESGQVKAAESVKSRSSIEDFTLHALHEAAYNIAYTGREPSFEQNLEKEESIQPDQKNPSKSEDLKRRGPGGRKGFKEGGKGFKPGGRKTLRDRKKSVQRTDMQNGNNKMRTLSLKDAALARDEMKLGKEAMKEGDYQKAVKHFRTAAEITPGFARAFYNLGKAYNLNREHAKALKAFNKSIELNPVFVDARLERIDIWIHEKMLDKAESELNHIIQANKLEDIKRARALGQLAKVKAYQGFPNEAILILDKAIEADNRNPNFFIGKAHILNGQEKYKEAEVTILTAIELENNRYMSWFILGQIHKNRNENKKAIGAFEKAEKFAKNKEQKANAKVMIQSLNN